MILVTGGTGFIGRNLIRSLVDSGKQVRVLLRPSRVSPSFPTGISVEVAVSSLADKRSLRAALRDVTMIFHLVGAERYGVKGDLSRTDIEGTATLLHAAQGLEIERFFYLSQLGADRGSAYPVQKAKGIAENWVVNSSIPYTIFRTSAIYGRGDQFTIPLVRALKLSPGFFLMPGDGKTLLQPLYIDDLITCLILSMENSRTANRVLSIGGIETISFLEIVKIVMKKTGIKRIPIPASPQFLRTLTLWIDQIFPSFPISIYWLDNLAQDRITNLDTIPREFSLLPGRFKNNLDYLRKD